MVFGKLGAFATRDFLAGGVCPFSSSSSSSRARFFAAAALGTAFLAATLTAADLEDLGTVVLVLLVDFDSALLCGGVVREDDIFPSGTIRLDINPGGSLCNDVRKFFLRSHGNIRKIIDLLDFEAMHCLFVPALRAPALFLVPVVVFSTTVLALLADSSRSLRAIRFLHCPSP